jgi:CRISPR-associated protein Cmr2
MSVHVEFSVGPVQAFVAQARRTRDFWGGSYLLSFLTAHAIRGALGASAKVSPEQIEKDPLVRWVSGERQGEPQSMGSVPNHFTATASDLEHAGRIARAAEDALREAWKRVCDAVWDNFIKEAAACGISTRGIWERQVSSFWEIVWVAGDNAPELLARRKLWRTCWPPDEPGDKCSVMSTYQELSGHIRARAREAQDSFWARVRQKSGDLDIQQGERLCAITLVKRLYARCAEQSIGWRLDTSAWPSTVDFAALPWVRRVLAHPESNVKAQAYAEMVRTCAPAGALEGARHFRRLDNGGNFARLNGDYIHPTALVNSRVTPLLEESNRPGLREALAKLAKVEDAEGALGYPPRYYALLLADGDKLGNLLKNSPASASAVGAALDRFTSEAGPLSEDSDAVRVYAGGDDIFALLPFDGALAYADKVAVKYQECFFREKLTATLSGAVVFAQMTVPLTRVLAEARRLLDKVAKEQNGRNSLAVGVCQSSGLALEWVSAWERNDSRAVNVLGRLVAILKEQKSDVSSGVIHRVHSLLWRFLGEEGWRPGKCLKGSRDTDIRKLVLAEILHSLEKRSGPGSDNQTRAENATAAIWDMLLVTMTSNEKSPRETQDISTDGLRLAVFLAGGGNEEEHQ